MGHHASWDRSAAIIVEGGERESVLLLVGIFFFPNPPSHPSFPSLLLANPKIMIYA